jgi:dTDP-4-amino-4,6-dideoxygalactose transaminase
MIETKRRKQILARERSRIYSQGEPYLGAYYTDEEIKAVVETIRASMDPSIGFIGSLRGKYVEGNPLEKFEREFADFRGMKHCIAINGAGTGLDMAMMALDLEPGDEVIVPAINFRAAPLAVVGQGGKVV